MAYDTKTQAIDAARRARKVGETIAVYRTKNDRYDYYRPAEAENHRLPEDWGQPIMEISSLGTEWDTRHCY